MVAYIETKNNINDLKLAAMNDMECNTQVIESNNTMVKENDLQSACEYATHLVCNLGFDHYKAVNALLKEGLDNETAEMVVAEVETAVSTSCQSTSRSEAMGTIATGLLFAVGGGILSCFTNYIFYGAVIYGVVKFF